MECPAPPPCVVLMMGYFPPVPTPLPLTCESATFNLVLASSAIFECTILCPWDMCSLLLPLAIAFSYVKTELQLPFSKRTCIAVTSHTVCVLLVGYHIGSCFILTNALEVS